MVNSQDEIIWLGNHLEKDVKVQRRGQPSLCSVHCSSPLVTLAAKALAPGAGSSSPAQAGTVPRLQPPWNSLQSELL